MKIEIKKTARGKLYFCVLAGNNKELLKSGHYASKRTMADAIATLKAGLPEAKVVDLV